MRGQGLQNKAALSNAPLVTQFVEREINRCLLGVSTPDSNDAPLSRFVKCFLKIWRLDDGARGEKNFVKQSWAGHETPPAHAQKLPHGDACKGSTRYWKNLEDYWPCAGELSALYAIGTSLRDLINSNKD